MTRLTPLLLAVAVTGCGPSPDSDDATRSAAHDGGDAVVFHRGGFSEPDTLDPHRSEETGAADILRDLFEGLVGETREADIAPGVAESWDVADDGLTYTFHLRDDTRWSNGDPVVAADFVAGLRRPVDPATASTYAQLLYPIRNAEAVASGELETEALGVEALDARTLEIELETPTPYFLQLLTHPTAMPLHRASYAEHGERFTRPGNLVSNGAYRLAEWVVNSHIKLERNTHYWRDDVQIDTVYYHNTEDINSELTRYRAGELDYTYQTPTTQFDWIKRNLGDELHVSPYISVYFYGFDVTEPPFDDVRVRQALSMAIDRGIITEQVTGRGELPAFGLVPDGVSSYMPARYDWRTLDDDERMARARELYRAAGYSEDNPLHAELRYNTSENHKRVAVAVAAMWKQTLGADISLVNEEWKVMLQTRRVPARWDIMRYGWRGDYNDAYTFLEIFRSGHGQNFTGYASAEYDALTERATVERDAEARARIMHDAERAVLEDYVFVPIYFYVSDRLVKPYVEGYVGNIMDHNLTRHFRVLDR